MIKFRNQRRKIFKKIALAFLMIIPIAGIALICNTVVARYTGHYDQNLTFIAYPNNTYNYYIYDNAGSRTGAYDSANSITESFTVRATTEQTIYQIKLPVTEEGYYRLSFMVDFVKDGATSKDLTCSTVAAKAVGCMVVHEEDYPFGKTSSRLILFTAGSTTSLVPETNGNKVTYSNHPMWYADDHYMWKTLAPSLAERVNLTYKVNSADVDNGYVIWAWTFYGLTASTKYTISLTEINSSKLEVVDSDKPYLDFTKIQYVNNTINPDSCSVYGYTRNAPGKGTYVTEASHDSLTMQVAPLYAKWNPNGEKETNISSLAGEGYSGADGTAYENLIGLNIPLKNVEYDKNYKVTFDFSVARQGTTDTDNSALKEEDVLYDSSYSRFFWNLESTNVARTLHFQSYLHSGAVSGRQISTHTSGRGQIALKNARYSPHEVTRFDEFRQLTNGTASTDFVYNSAGAINSLSNTGDSPKNVRFFNAVRHTEVNGQNELYWLTFYNTTFTFNISSTLNSGKNLNLDDLYWVWGIDSLRPGRWYRLKIENVRLEEVEQYGSNVNWNGIKIAGTQVTRFNYYDQASGQTEETYLRGANGTGQNYQALQGTTRSNGTTTPGIPMASINTYGPIYDASTDIVAVGAKDTSGKAVKGDNDYKIHLDGYCVIKGGVDRYVWSADNGETWHDMIIETSLGEADITTLAYAERRVDQAQRATIDTHQYYARYPSYFDDTLIDESIDADGYRIENKDHANDYVDFIKSDGVNSVFTDFRMYADISQYAGVWNLDIIFAAVPKTNANARCELLRITNLNKGTLYRSLIYDVASDIQVTSEYGTYEDAATPKNMNAIDDFTSSNTWADACFNKPFNEMKGIAYGVGPSGAMGYASLTNPKSIKDMMPLISGIPVKNKLIIKGWNICAGGTEGYYYSVDEGSTWKPCQGSPATSTSTNTTLVNQAIWWMNNRTLTSDDVINAIFSGDATALSIDLSAYEGKVVNVVVAAKPISNAQFCPIAKVNSIPVCGDRIFYSKVTNVTVDGTKLEGIVTYDNLNLNTTSVSGSSYTAFEPYNIDLFATRKLTKYSVDVTSGSTVLLDGFIMCKGGVKHYKYTIDGGETWTVLEDGNIANGTQFTGPSASILKVAALIDIELDTSAGANGNFATSHTSPDRNMEIVLPTFRENKKYNLLVVAVANDGKDTLYPVMHLPINVIG